MEQSVRRYNTRSSRSPATSERTATKRRHSSQTRVLDDKSSPVTSAKKKEKKKRRSSIKRRSIVATLKCIQSNEVSSVANADNASADKAPNVAKENKKCSSQDAEEKPEKTVVPPNGFSSLLVQENEKDDRYVQRLKAEIKDWKVVVNEYKNIEREAEERLKSPSTDLSSSILRSSESCFEYSKQINDLEDRLANAVSIVSDTMANVQKIRDLHKLNLAKEREKELSLVSRGRGGDDPKWLIENIFKLDNMVIDT